MICTPFKWLHRVQSCRAVPTRYKAHMCHVLIVVLLWCPAACFAGSSPWVSGQRTAHRNANTARRFPPPPMCCHAGRTVPKMKHCTMPVEQHMARYRIYMMFLSAEYTEDLTMCNHCLISTGYGSSGKAYHTHATYRQIHINIDTYIHTYIYIHVPRTAGYACCKLGTRTVTAACLRTVCSTAHIDLINDLLSTH